MTTEKIEEKNAPKNHYEALGVKPDASHEAIEKAYQEKSEAVVTEVDNLTSKMIEEKQNSPDDYAPSPEDEAALSAANDKLEQLKEAHAVLSDENERKAYDDEQKKQRDSALGAEMTEESKAADESKKPEKSQGQQPSSGAGGQKPLTGKSMFEMMLEMLHRMEEMRGVFKEAAANIKEKITGLFKKSKDEENAQAPGLTQAEVQPQEPDAQKPAVQQPPAQVQTPQGQTPQGQSQNAIQAKKTADTLALNTIAAAAQASVINDSNAVQAGVIEAQGNEAATNQLLSEQQGLSQSPEPAPMTSLPPAEGTEAKQQEVVDAHQEATEANTASPDSRAPTSAQEQQNVNDKNFSR